MSQISPRDLTQALAVFAEDNKVATPAHTPRGPTASPVRQADHDETGVKAPPRRHIVGGSTARAAGPEISLRTARSN